MRSFLEWLLSLDRLDLHEARRVSLQWLDPFEAWVWFILILVVPTYVILIYRHESGTVRSRVLMAGGRALLILFTLMLLCSPALVDRRDRTEPSTVAILIDQSASMARADRYNSDEWRQLVGLVPPVQPSKGWQRRKLLEAILATEEASGFGLQPTGASPGARSPEPGAFRTRHGRSSRRWALRVRVRLRANDSRRPLRHSNRCDTVTNRVG